MSVAHLIDHITARFARLSSLSVLGIPLDLDSLEAAEDPPPNPSHPACAEFADTDYCQESWQLHIAELQRCPETFWHKCEYGRFCALVPLVFRDRCLAVFKMVCPDTFTEEKFEQQVGILDVLVDHVALSEGESLARLLHDDHAPRRAEGPAPTDEAANPDLKAGHAKVLSALKYIDAHLADPKLSVRGIALAHDIHPDYLAHLFAGQVGERMSRYIAARRIERAKNLLLATDWQIKRIAHEAGYANANWFSHVFGVQTGLTPGDYRRRWRGRQEAGPGR